MALVNGYYNIYTIELWNDNYGIRSFLPYADIHTDVMSNCCYDSTTNITWKAVFTNDCFVLITAQRKNKQGNWEQVNIKRLNGASVNNPSLVKYQTAGWNQSSEDLYINLQLDLPIEDYAFGDSIKINAKLYPEWANENALNNFPYSVVERSYTVYVEKSCLPKPGGCPYLHVKDINGDYTVENNVLHRSEFSPQGMDITDRYKLVSKPLINHSKIELYLVENEHDDSFIEQVKMYAIDYPISKKMGITEDNEIVLYDSGYVIASDTVLLNATNVTNNLHYNHPASVRTVGYSGDSMYAHFPNPDGSKRKKNFKTAIDSRNSNEKNSNQLSSMKNNSGISYPIAFITETGNQKYPISGPKDTAGVLTATSYYSNSVTGIFARRELPSVVILPLFSDTDAVRDIKIKFQSNFQMGYIGAASLSYTGYDMNEMPLTDGENISLQNSLNIVAELSDIDTKYGMVDDSNFIKMKFDCSALPILRNDHKREYVIEILGHTINGDSGSALKNTQNTIPLTFSLSQNYPNPFNPVTSINYDLPRNTKVTLVVYDILGREVIKLVNNEFKQAGRYKAEFNGNNLASGVYFYRIEAGDFVLAKKMVLLK